MLPPPIGRVGLGGLGAPLISLVSPLEIQEQQEEKGCLMVMADPSDLGHGKKRGKICVYIIKERAK